MDDAGFSVRFLPSLMFREHHFEDVVNGSAPDANRSREGQGSPQDCNAKCASIATRNATPRASASGSTEPHKTPETAATTRVATGSSEITPVIKTDPSLLRVGSTGLEQPAFLAGNTAVAISCDAKCDAISANRIELLTRAVILVAGMNLAEAERAAVLARVIADLTSPTTRILE